MYNQFPSLAEAFLNYFDVQLAVTPQQMDAVGRIRYRVYCEEFGFEPAEAFPNRREADEYDDNSMHCLIVHSGSGHPAGCIRMVCAGEDLELPMEAHCRDSIYLEYLDVLAEDRSQICEISRLAVDAAFRKRPGEDHTRLGEFDAMDCSHQEVRSFSLVGIALYLAAFAMAGAAGRTQIFGMSEHNLPRLLRRSGILVQQAGDPMEYHGLRSAHFITADLALENMRDDLHFLYDAIAGQLSESFQQEENVA